MQTFEEIVNSYLGDAAELAKQASITTDSQPAVDNAPESGQTGEATTGARSAENDKDIEKIPGNNVDGSPAGGPAKDTGRQNKSPESGPTGTDVPAVKSTVSDPGTSHPAQAGTEKYGSFSEAAQANENLMVQIADLLKEAETVSEAAPEGADKQNIGVEDAEQESDDDNPEDADNGGDKADVMEGTDAVDGSKKSASAGEVIIKKAELEELQAGNELLTELLGALAAQHDLSELQKQSSQQQIPADAQSQQQYHPQQIKQAQEKVAEVQSYAQWLGREVADYVESHQKSAMGMLPGAEALPAGAAEGEEAGPEVSEEELALLAELLAEQGVAPEELMEMGGGEVAPEEAALAEAALAEEAAMNPEAEAVLAQAAPEESASAASDIDAAAAVAPEAAESPEESPEAPGGSEGDSSSEPESEEDTTDKDKGEDKSASAVNPEQVQALAQALRQALIENHK